jgi:hypothetical protein
VSNRNILTNGQAENSPFAILSIPKNVDCTKFDSEMVQNRQCAFPGGIPENAVWPAVNIRHPSLTVGTEAHGARARTFDQGTHHPHAGI